MSKTEKRVLTQEDLDNNPELVKQGFNVGSEIEVPVTPKSSKTFFYWVKVESYVSETGTWKPGLYQVAERIERLDKSSIDYVEAFEDEIPEVILVEIAKRYGIATEYVEDSKRKIKPAEEILETLVVKK